MVLKVRSERLTDQCVLPTVGKGCVVAVATAQGYPPELGGDAQGVGQNLRRNVIAIDQYGHGRFRAVGEVLRDNGLGVGIHGVPV